MAWVWLCNRNVPFHWTRVTSEISNRNEKRPLRSRFGHFTTNDKVDKLWFHPKTSQSHVWAVIKLFELFCLLIIECYFFEKRNFEDNFSAKIEVSGWMKTNMAAASYHPRIWSPRYGQTGNLQKNLAVNHWPLERGLTVQTWTSMQTANLTARPWSRDFLTFAVRGKCQKTSILRSLIILALTFAKKNLFFSLACITFPWTSYFLSD